MGISLSNHEDRIKKLESSTGVGRVTFQYIGLIGSAQYDLSNLPSDQLHILDFTAAWSVEYYSYRINHICVPWMKGHDIPKRDTMHGSNFSYENYFEITGNILKLSGARGSGSHINLRITSLKLYYNFSYNIYRLANSISFHFFKCLINSFKGGVKEIWQLVLRIMTIV